MCIYKHSHYETVIVTKLPEPKHYMTTIGLAGMKPNIAKLCKTDGGMWLPLVSSFLNIAIKSNYCFLAAAIYIVSYRGG